MDLTSSGYSVIGSDRDPQETLSDFLATSPFDGSRFIIFQPDVNRHCADGQEWNLTTSGCSEIYPACSFVLGAVYKLRNALGRGGVQPSVTVHTKKHYGREETGQKMSTVATSYC